jgi:hypothetical protein
MPLNWEDFPIRKDDPYEPQDFRNAAYQLLSSQILYETTAGQGGSYRLIDRYRDAFREAFDLFGIALKFDSDYRYIAAIPSADKQLAMPKLDALLLLVLRKGYHEQAIQGNLDAGVAMLSIEELRELYRAETTRELPKEVGELKDILGRMRAFGVTRLPHTEPGSEQPFDIAILPGITALVSEVALGRLTEYAANTRAGPEPESNEA